MRRPVTFKTDVNDDKITVMKDNDSDGDNSSEGHNDSEEDNGSDRDKQQLLSTNSAIPK